MARSSCPPPDALDRLLNEGLAGDERALIVDHVECCPACQKRLDALVDDGLITSSQRDADPNSDEGPVSLIGPRTQR